MVIMTIENIFHSTFFETLLGALLSASIWLGIDFLIFRALRRWEIKKENATLTTEEKADALNKVKHPSSGQSLIYVIRPSFLGFLIPAKIRVDQDLIGTTKGRSYLAIEVQPGVHEVTSKRGKISRLSLQTEADRIYFFEQELILKTFSFQLKLVMIGEEKGLKLIRRCKPRQTLQGL